MKNKFKISVILFGICFTIFFIVCCMLSNFNLGNVLVLVLGVIITFWYIVPDNKFFKVVKMILRIGGMVYLTVALFIFCNSFLNKPDFNEDAVIVLGCGVHGDKPSLDLRLRLDKAIEYYGRNRDCVICVSGGQGPQEDIAEADAMATYLTRKGIPEEKIIKEGVSASTSENFWFSKKLLDNYFGRGGYRIVYITNDFHSYRAGLTAKKNGFENASSYPSKTGAYMLIANYMRETLAVIYTWIIG